MTTTRIALVPTPTGWKRPDCGCVVHVWDGVPGVEWDKDTGYSYTGTLAPHLHLCEAHAPKEA